MYSLISHRGIYNEAIKKYIVDYEYNVGDVPTDAPAGSECFVIENSATYMLNHEKRGVKVYLSAGYGSGSGGSVPDDDNSNPDKQVVYEGGVI